jgi:hypothetical protein
VKTYRSTGALFIKLSIHYKYYAPPELMIRHHFIIEFRFIKNIASDVREMHFFKTTNPTGFKNLSGLGTTKNPKLQFYNNWNLGFLY